MFTEVTIQTPVNHMQNVKKNIPSSSDLGIVYFTSSKYIKTRFHEFTWTIIAEFFDAKDAYDFEQLLIFESWKLPGTLNKHCTHGKAKWNTTGVPMSDDTTLKVYIAKANNSKGPPSIESRLKMSVAKLGVSAGPHSDETKLKIHIAKKGVKQPIITCPHCNKSGGESNIKRYHFDNCKFIT